jgi:hypothetical protein
MATANQITAVYAFVTFLGCVGVLGLYAALRGY